MGFSRGTTVTLPVSLGIAFLISYESSSSESAPPLQYLSTVLYTMYPRLLYMLIATSLLGLTNKSTKNPLCLFTVTSSKQSISDRARPCLRNCGATVTAETCPCQFFFTWSDQSPSTLPRRQPWSMETVFSAITQYSGHLERYWPQKLVQKVSVKRSRLILLNLRQSNMLKGLIVAIFIIITLNHLVHDTTHTS
ncbi:hypothetical protein FGO68_gene682 [Halteria grandinella]|uniref:Uncharacterized protein n=1 Tax=Halteria grandinella TaxID=5974 RepID=A0A8J8SXZ3_HALGN|nr:hypothetical protein FGO68_gene682 [Halteria grandinella]